MTSELPAPTRASYSAIIDTILAASDLNTISAKRIRKGLQEQVGVDLTPQKQAITDLIMERFDKAQTRQDLASSNPPTEPTSLPLPTPLSNGDNTNTHSPSAGAKPPSPHPLPTTNLTTNPTTTTNPPTHSNKRKPSPSPSPDPHSSLPADPANPAPSKKAKKTKPDEPESDEVIAARLQAELNSQTNSRATRGGGAAARRKTPAKSKPKAKKKSSAKVAAEDDSELEGEDGAAAEKPEKEKKGGFHKPMHLSAPLAAMLGETQLSRPQTVKRIWDYVKARDLQDPSDKRQIVCDPAMRAVFKGDKVHMFTMNKVLAHHLFPVDET